MTDSYNGMMNGSFGWMVAWMSVGFLIVVTVLAIAVLAIMRLAQARQGSPDEASQLLRRRFATGEIGADEYASRRNVLGRSL